MRGTRGCAIGGDFVSLFEMGSFASLTDGQLLERFQEGPDEVAHTAFKALVHRHGRMVLRTCRRILRDEHEAHDAFQSTFLVLVRKGKSLWVHQSLGPWLHRVACRAAIQASRARERRQTVEIDAITRLDSPRQPGVSDELLSALHEELDRLPDHYRSAIVLCDLEGRSCEETARLLGCPIGTVGSRLSRGRDKLRHRLIRRGFTPSVGVVAGTLSQDVVGASLAQALVSRTVGLAMQFAAGCSAGSIPATVAGLTRQITRRLAMSQLRKTCALVAILGGVGFVPLVASMSPAGTRPSAQELSGSEKKPPIPNRELTNFEKRHESYVLAEMGNMPPLVHKGQGVAFTSREAILYRDGTVKLWTVDDSRQVCPPLRHTGPIREVSFLDSAGLVVTTSDETVKIWDAATGAPRKELPGQVARPLFFLQDKSAAKWLVTLDIAGQVVTAWDTMTLQPVKRWNMDGHAKLLGAALSNDGSILVTIGADHSVTLWQADTKQAFATLRPPSSLLQTVFVDSEVKVLPGPVIQIRENFWKAIHALAPATPGAMRATK